MVFFELIPSQEDAVIFLKTTGTEWNKVTISPWAAVVDDKFFLVTNELSQVGWGRVFDTRERASAYSAFARLRGDFFPVSVKIEEMGEESLFLVHQKMK
jgi:hypothetical protein